MRLITIIGLAASCAWATGIARAEEKAAGEGQADPAAVVKGNNEFALDLYAKLRNHEGNLFVSPNSISTALAMTYAGTRGQTAEQMAKTLHFSLDQESLASAFGALLKQLNGEGKERGYQLNVANALWGQKGYRFLPEFVKLTRDNYGAGLNEIDFAADPEAARMTINGWVEKETNAKIKDLLKPNVLSNDTRLVLTNAIYFKGQWVHAFKKSQTHDGPFSVGGDEKVTVPMMNQKEHFKYLEASSFQALEMPYEGKDLAMIVLLPKDVNGLAEFEKTLTKDNLAGWLARMSQQEVVVSLPRFHLTGEFQLNSVLSGMGMSDAFDERAADFSGMDGKKDLFLSAVVHKAFVDVNEEGTEAAAATGAMIRPTMVRITPVFRADHPFMFLIRDNRTGSILFMGRMTKPQQ